MRCSNEKMSSFFYQSTVLSPPSPLKTSRIKSYPTVHSYLTSVSKFKPIFLIFKCSCPKIMFIFLQNMYVSCLLTLCLASSISGIYRLFGLNFIFLKLPVSAALLVVGDKMTGHV